MKTRYFPAVLACLLVLAGVCGAEAQQDRTLQGSIFQVGTLKPLDSELKVKVGDMAPDFDLPSISGQRVRLSEFRGKKNVVLSFVPAAWTPVCSGQWPGYNIAREKFEALDTTIVGVSVDNVPTLYAWVKQMGGLWFPVVSDFHPQGATAQAYGILRSSGEAERSLFLVDKQGVIRYLDVHDINSRPDLGAVIRAIQSLPR